MRKPFRNLGLARIASGLVAAVMLLCAVTALAQDPPQVYTQENTGAGLYPAPVFPLSRNSLSFGNCRTRFCLPMGYATPGGLPRSITDRITWLRLRNTGRVQNPNVRVPRQIVF